MLNALLGTFLLLVVWASAPAQAQGVVTSPAVESEFSRAELLVHAPNGVATGEPLWLGLQIRHAPDWHTYWKNPGDSGLPTEFEWQVPAGVQPEAVQWPTPRKFPLGDLANYGYDGTVLLPIPVRVGADFSGDVLRAEVFATWLICRKECIPEEARFEVQIPVNMSYAAHATAFESAWEAVPQDLSTPGSQLIATAERLGADLRGLPIEWVGQPLELFPETPGLIEPGAPWTQRWEGGIWHADIPLNRFRSAGPEMMTLVIAPANPAGQGPGDRGIRTDVPVPQGWPEATVAGGGASDALRAALAENAARAAMSSSLNTSTLTLWAALVGAFVGGMILNLMPCVFPVLAIKVLAFSAQGTDARAHRVNGLAYTAGVVVSFLALGGALLALRAAGEQLGWGFQLQNPAVVASLALLFVLIGLNLAGLFEFGQLVPSSVASLQAKHPTADAFLTGVLATVVASPCTAPFMGASLGLAIALPPAQALAVFAALGMGMATPYLAASWVPAVTRWLPRPGAWMETFRQFMAFPMFATVVWLLWVLGQQSGIHGVSALLMIMVVMTLVIWTVNRRGYVRTVGGTLSLAVLAWSLWAVGPQVIRETAPSGTTAPTSQEGVVWEAWTPQREADLLAAGRSIFVDYTAAWCVSCQYNKRNALANEEFLMDVAERGVVLLRADWTRRDPAVTEALARLGRNGVPVYVVHAPGKPPRVLSEILTVEEVRSAIQQL